MLSQSAIEIIKTITPAVAANAEAITRRFYERMFLTNPEVKQFFNEAHQHSGGQQKALAGAICSYFSNIDNLTALIPAVEIIAQKHCSLGIRPQHYPIVGRHLLDAIRDVMGSAVTEPVVSAVSDAYSVLADICIDREKQIYQNQVTQPGGWNGYRKFVVSQKAPESLEVTSFYLRPEDKGTLPSFEAGQYLTVKIQHSKVATSPRNYSLSDRPNTGYFRISVKREIGQKSQDPQGIVSSYLHDSVEEGSTIELGPPCGEFVLKSQNDRPVVFLAGGIGVTPLLSMAKHLVHTASKKPIYFIQMARNSNVRAFGKEIESLRKSNEKFQPFVLFNEPLSDDFNLGRCDAVGTLSKEFLRERTPYREAEFYFCGPPVFMKQVYSHLRELDVPRGQLNYEFFGPRQEIENHTNPS